MRLLFVGDIMPGGLLPYQKEYISPELVEYLRKFDCRIGTLESAMGDGLDYDEEKMNGKMNIIYSPSKEIFRLKEMGVNVVSLANNHTFDLGSEGLDNTIKLLNKAGILWCGAGRNKEEAKRPAVIELKGKKIAFLAACQYGTVYIGHVKKPTEKDAGINLLDINSFCDDIRAAKQQYDYVFALPHWGVEYTYLPTPECRNWARKMIEAGADGVFGSHPHQIQPLIHYQGKPIAFSMGNFIFPDYYMEVPRPISYPDPTIDTSSWMRYEFYPNIIAEPCVQVWRHTSRIGMMVECDVEGCCITAKYKLAYLSKRNILGDYSKPNAMRCRMKWMGWIAGLPRYTGVYNFYESKLNIPRRGWHVLNRVLKQIK